MFIVGGFNAYPAEIENIMIGHRGGRVGGGRRRSRTRASARSAWRSWCPRPEPTSTPTRSSAWCRENMANYKVPRYVEIVDDLPLNASNKVLKYELAARGKQVLEG